MVGEYVGLDGVIVGSDVGEEGINVGNVVGLEGTTLGPVVGDDVLIPPELQITRDTF